MDALVGWLSDYYSPHEDTGRGLNPERPRWWILLRIATAAAIVTAYGLWGYPYSLRLLDGDVLSLAGCLAIYLIAAAVIRPRIELEEFNPFYVPDDGGSFISVQGRILILVILLPGRIVVEAAAEALLLGRYAFSGDAWRRV